MKRNTSSRNIKRSSVPRSLANSMIYKTSFVQSPLTSNGSGVIANWNSPSISQSSEYSTIQSLFTQVRLIACEYTFIPAQTNTSAIQGLLLLGTNMIQNQSTGVTPTNFSDVQNLTSVVKINTSRVTNFTYRMVVPKALEFASVTADAPSPPTPWAGCPGIIAYYSTALTASTVYFQIHIQAVYELRGRQ